MKGALVQNSKSRQYWIFYNDSKIDIEISFFKSITKPIYKFYFLYQLPNRYRKSIFNTKTHSSSLSSIFHLLNKILHKNHRHVSSFPNVLFQPPTYSFITIIEIHYKFIKNQFGITINRFINHHLLSSQSYKRT